MVDILRHRQIRVFIGTPGDVESEQKAIQRVVEKINGEISLGLGVTFEILKGISHSTPGLSRPQALITPLVDQCDVFIGVLWNRFGTPPGTTEKGEVFESGTEEEFTRALTRWENDGARINSTPRIMLYFSDQTLEPSKLDTNQMETVRKFRTRFGASGRHPGLVSSYNSMNLFEDQVRRHLIQIALSYSPNISQDRLISDFVEISPKDWTSLFNGSSFLYLLFMYSRTWRNTYLNEIRNMLLAGGNIKIVMPNPDISNPALELMAKRINCSAKDLAERIKEATDEFLRLNDDGRIDIRFTNQTLNHAMYLFDTGGVIGMYNYRTDRSSSPAAFLAKGALHDQFVKDYLFAFNKSNAI